MEYLAALAIAATVLVSILALGGSKDGARSRLDAIRRPPATGPVPVPESRAPSLSRIVSPLIRAFAQLMPTGMLQGIEQRLILAGEPMTVNAFLMMRLVCGGLFFALPLLIVFGGGIKLGLTALLIIASPGRGWSDACRACGYLPAYRSDRTRSSRRCRTRSTSLRPAWRPVLVWMLRSLASRRRSKALFADELTRTLHDISLGKMRREAPRVYASDRCARPDHLRERRYPGGADGIQHRCGTARPVRAAAHKAPPARRAGGLQGAGKDDLSAGPLYLPDALYCDSWAGCDYDYAGLSRQVSTLGDVRINNRTRGSELATQTRRAPTRLSRASSACWAGRRSSRAKRSSSSRAARSTLRSCASPSMSSTSIRLRG